MNVTQKLINEHLVEGSMELGREIALKIDQTLTQDATGTLVMLELEAMGIDRVQTEVSAQYIDHNILQVDNKNPDDHLFLYSAAQRFGLWYSKAGNGVSHIVHQERFGKPGKTLLGSDSHTPAEGAIGMLAIGAGGLEVALAMIGEPYYVRMPQVWGVRLTGSLPDWVSAKDVVLEMLRRHGVRGAKGRVLEYYGPGLEGLTVMDRHVIANMGTELGAVTTVFPSDHQVKRYLRRQKREEDWREILSDSEGEYDFFEEINLSELEPLVALPSSPGKVARVADIAGEEIYQSYVGSSANPGYRDFAIVSEIFKNRYVAKNVSFDVNPTSNQILLNLARDGHLANLAKAGARIHQSGCNGCIGMGQAPATDKISLRTVPRNFPGRSGTLEDKVYLVSPETAAASALTGVITDPRTLGFEYPQTNEPEEPLISTHMIVPPLPLEQARQVKLRKGPNVGTLPRLEPVHENERLPVLLKVGDDISTDEVLPAGANVLPWRSNIERISEYAFIGIDDTYSRRAREPQYAIGHIIVGGENYGQGSSREHAALAPRYLGLKLVLAKSFARIHWENLVNFGVVPLQFTNPTDYLQIEEDDVLSLKGIHTKLPLKEPLMILNESKSTSYEVFHTLSDRQIEIVLAGGVINLVEARRKKARAS